MDPLQVIQEHLSPEVVAAFQQLLANQAAELQAAHERRTAELHEALQAAQLEHDRQTAELHAMHERQVAELQQALQAAQAAREHRA